MTDRHPTRARARTVVGQLVMPLRQRVSGLAHLGLERRVTWISGSPRTGSTWLGNMLAALTGGPMIDEPLIGTHLATPVAVISGQHAPGDGTLIVEAFAQRPDYFFSEQHAKTWVPGLRRLVLDRLAASVPGRRDVPVLVKEPNGARGIPVLVRALPRSRLLFLVRDGRDVVDSMLDGADDGWISDNLGVSVADYGGREGLLRTRAEQWVREVDAVQTAFDAHDPGRRLLVRYEDLRADPLAELRRVTGWLDCPQTEDRLGEIVATFDVERVPRDRRGPGRFVRAATVGGWRHSFDPAEQELVADIMGPALARLGYT